LAPNAHFSAAIFPHPKMSARNHMHFSTHTKTVNLFVILFHLLQAKTNPQVNGFLLDYSINKQQASF
jgi:hypothetical protein